MRLIPNATALAATCLLFAVAPATAAAGIRFSQGFTKNTSGWAGAVTRVRSGYANGGGYASGIPSARGRAHARLGTPSEPACMPGMSGSQCDGPYSEMGLGFTDAQFPKYGYSTQLSVYLDTSFAATHNDYRFDLESAINDTSGNYLQGFDFNVGTTLATEPTPGFVIGASTNADRSGAYPENPCPAPSAPPNSCRAPVTITTSGWYAFRDTFRDVGGALTVTMQVLTASGTTVPGADWTIVSQNPALDAGGPALLWFPNQEINELAVDSERLRSNKR